ncbi:FAD synthase [Patescibacteria group bacterium]|nr:FAD synthase [Patescibacteria group bacterium]MBU2508985.1 FAD synthase [Patescibacteria group bacterium]
MCFGTFDGLHAGHEDYFRQAREHGDRLIVVVARDSTVFDVKGEMPLSDEQERFRAIDENDLVDEVFLGHPDDKYFIIEELQPDIICLGYDQETFTDELDIELTRRGMAATVVRCEPYFPNTFKSSLLRGARVTSDGYQEDEGEDGIPL